MSAKDYFKLGENLNVSSQAKSLDEAGREAESAEYISSHTEQKERFIPHVDFSSASNFARYGSAEQYYEDAVKRVYQTYPYDGSLRERIEWQNSSSYIDKYIFDNKYPRTNGYINLSVGGWGTLSGAAPALSGGYGSPGTSDLEYIQVKGGPHPDPDEKTMVRAFPGIHDGDANFYHAKTRRKSNLALDPVNGFSVEFWLKKKAFTNAKTEKEVIFDLWNGEASSSAGYGRLTIELTGASGASPFLVTIQSGTDGYFQQSIGSSPTETTLTDWNHYAFTFASSSLGNIETKFYISGGLDHTLNTGTVIEEVTGSLIANIGGLRTAPSGNLFYKPSQNTTEMEGFGKLSGSLDEFRYWTKKRTSKDINTYWFAQVAGGTNTDVSLTGTYGSKYDENNTVDLGVYYKFNEGITLTSSTDSTVLDYSGRISNGTWTGYVGSNSRHTGSAIILASASLDEFEDPIIYSYHTDVDGLLTSLKTSGSTYDLRNNAGIYHTLPAWITEEDKDAQTLKKLTQVIASYFDTLHMQIENLPKIKDTNYTSASFKPLPFTERLLDNFGFVSPNILNQATELENLANRDQVRNFNEKIYDVKNLIYENIYNNLVYIYKSKGTEKSFRNLIRCFGVDDELLRLNLYANNTTFEIRDNYRSTAYRKKFAAFNRPESFGASVYMSASTDSNSVVSFISGSKTDALSSEADYWVPWTLETEVVFPPKPEVGQEGHYNTPFLTSSLFGVHEAGDDSADFSWALKDNNNFQIYALREEHESKTVKFMLTSSLPGWPTLTSSFYEEVYDNQKWNFAVRFYVDKTNNGGLTKGGVNNDLPMQSGQATTPYAEFYGVNSVLDQVVNEFHLSGALTIADAANDPSNTAHKRIYIGAHRTNFTGALLQSADAKISSVRYWTSYLSNDVIKAHARDASNFGTLHPYENIGLTKQSLTGTHVPAIESLALHWDFDNVTGSDASGDFVVHDFSSGSAGSTGSYGWLGNVVKNQYAGRGENFPASSTSSISNEFLYSAKQRLPDNINSDNMVNILTQDDEKFTRESRPIKHYFAVEKSMYQTVSEEMINFFATIVDFNNLIGEPVNRYRLDYKDLGKIRQLFFERVRNTPSLEKYINFYKWIDSSISRMILQLVPASANMSAKLRNVVESHVLERNKYWNKFPTLEFKQKDPESGLHGITELVYPWKRGHAPISNNQADNCFWWQERAEPLALVASTGLEIIDLSGYSNTDSFDITVPDEDGLGGAGTAIRITLTSGDNDGSTSAGPGVIGVGVLSSPSAGTVAETIVDAINGYVGGTGTYEHSKAHLGSGDSASGVAGVTATLSGTTKITLTASTKGIIGDRISIANVVGDAATDGNLAGGVGDSTIDEQRKTFNAADKHRSGSAPHLASADGSVYTGSVYAYNRFTKPYRMDVERSRNIHGGVNFHPGKKLDYASIATEIFGDLVKIESSPGSGLFLTASVNYLLVTGSEVYSLKDCDDEIVPNQKRKYALNVKNSREYRENYGYSVGKGALLLPFNIHSSSVQTGYAKEIADSEFGKNLDGPVDFTNIHVDAYGGDNEVPLQSPFTEKHVGGRQHRHMAPLNVSSSRNTNLNGLDDQTDRPEAWYVLLGDGDPTFGIVGPTYTTTGEYDFDVPRATRMRSEFAKRPVNIRNIQQTTSSAGGTNIGNYETNWNVVGAAGRTQNNAYFRENGGVSLPPRLGNDLPTTTHAHSLVAVAATGSPGNIFGAVPTHSEYPGLVSNRFDSGSAGTLFSLPRRDLTGSDSVIVSRFSAPGGPEINSRGYLDIVAEEYSVHNALPFRNLSVRSSGSGEQGTIRMSVDGSPTHTMLRDREGLRTRLTRHCGLYGLDSHHGSTSWREDSTDEVASFHKVNRNPIKRIKEG